MMKNRIQFGFTLVEVTLALGIASFCLIAVIGLLPVGLASSGAATEETRAVDIAGSVITDLKETPISASATSLYGISLPTPAASLFNVDLNGKKLTTNTDISRRYTVKILAKQQTLYHPLQFVVSVSWPAWNGSDTEAVYMTTRRQGHVEMSTAFFRE